MLLVLGVLAGRRLLQISADLRSAKRALDRVGTQVEAGSLADARAGLAEAQGLVAKANAALYQSPEIDLISWLPVARQNVDALKGSVGVAFTLVNGGRRILDASMPLADEAGDLEVPLREGAIPLDTVASVRDEVEALASALPGPEAKASERLLAGPIAELQRDVLAEAARRRDQFRGVAQGLGLLDDLAGGNGDRRYLIAVANTAEMRGAGGMVLSYGELSSSDGDFELGDFGAIDELLLAGPIPDDAVSLPENYLERWGGLGVTSLWRNATMSSDFTLVAPVLEAMYEQATGQAVDGVIQVDPDGLAAILRGIGPVLVPNVGLVDADNVVSLTLNEAYTLFPERDVRQEVLGDVAKEVFSVLVDGEYDSLRPLGESVFRAGIERHILFHTVHPEAQGETRFFGADGGLPEADLQDYVQLTVQNLSRNKLDYYVDSALTLRGVRDAGKVGDVTATVTISNQAPADGTNLYVFGPFNQQEVRGRYRGVVSLYVPNGTKLVGADVGSAAGPPTMFGEGDRTLVSFPVTLDAGESAEVNLYLTFAPRPPGAYEVLLVPSPRVRPTVVTVDLAADGRRVAATQTLTSPVRLTASAAA